MMNSTMSIVRMWAMMGLGLRAQKEEGRKFPCGPLECEAVVGG